MTTSSSADLTQKSILHLHAEKSILHLHAAAHSLLLQSLPLSSHLASRLLVAAAENDVNLPQAYVETRLCQRCGTLYMPGVTCTVRSVQSRRQKRKARNLTWVVYDCKVCKGTFKTEVDLPHAETQRQRAEVQLPIEEKKSDVHVVSQGRAAKRKRERMQGLKSAIEKSKAEKTTLQLDLQDLMRVD
jgi:RNase P subunit RPR2